MSNNRKHAEAICTLTAEHGFTFFPCNDEKRPWDINNNCLLKGWQDGAGHLEATDLDDDSVDNVQMILDAGMYFATIPGKSNHVVVDIDTPQPYSSKAAWKATPKVHAWSVIQKYIDHLSNTFPIFRENIAVMPSVSGYGAHCWFRSYKPLTKFGCGQRGDIIGMRGYVVVTEPEKLLIGMNNEGDDNTLELFTQLRQQWLDDSNEMKGADTNTATSPGKAKSKPAAKGTASNGGQSGGPIRITQPTWDRVTPLKWNQCEQPLLSDPWPEGVRHHAFMAHYFRAWNSNDTQLEQDIIAKDLSHGRSEEDVMKRYRQFKSWWQDNQLPDTQEMSLVDKMKFISRQLTEQSPRMNRVYATNEAKEPLYFMNYSPDTGWTQLRHSDLRVQMTKIIDPFLKGSDKLGQILNEATTYHNSKMPNGGIETEWNHSINSIPFAGGNGKSVSLRGETLGEVITTPADDKMVETINCTAEEYTKARERVESGDQTEWDKQLELWQPCPIKRRRIRALFGQALTGNEQSAVPIIYGQGGEGKSVFMNAISKALSKSYTTSIKTEYFLQNGINNFEGHSDALMNLYKARIVWCGEVLSQRTTFKLDRIKKISGGDDIQANRMRQNNVTFTSRAMPVIFGNHLPKLTDVGRSTRRRFHIISFNVDIESALGRKMMVKGADMEDMLERMRPDIIVWLLDGLKDYVANGKQFPDCEEVDGETRRWFDANNTLQEQLEVILSPWEDESVPLKDVQNFLSAAYKAEYRHGVDGRWLKAEMEKMPKYRFKRTNKGMVLLGFRLNGNALGFDLG